MLHSGPLFFWRVYLFLWVSVRTCGGADVCALRSTYSWKDVPGSSTDNGRLSVEWTRFIPECSQGGGNANQPPEWNPMQDVFLVDRSTHQGLILVGRRGPGEC